MQVYQLYSTTEIAALFLSIVVGTIGYLGVVWKTNPKEVTIRYVLAILSINTTV